MSCDTPRVACDAPPGVWPWPLGGKNSVVVITWHMRAKTARGLLRYSGGPSRPFVGVFDPCLEGVSERTRLSLSRHQLGRAISQFKSFGSSKHAEIFTESFGIVVCRFVGTLPDILGLV